MALAKSRAWRGLTTATAKPGACRAQAGFRSRPPVAFMTIRSTAFPASLASSASWPPSSLAKAAAHPGRHPRWRRFRSYLRRQWQRRRYMRSWVQQRFGLPRNGHGGAPSAQTRAPWPRGETGCAASPETTDTVDLWTAGYAVPTFALRAILWAGGGCPQAPQRIINLDIHGSGRDKDCPALAPRVCVNLRLAVCCVLLAEPFKEPRKG